MVDATPVINLHHSGLRHAALLAQCEFNKTSFRGLHHRCDACDEMLRDDEMLSERLDCVLYSPEMRPKEA